MINVGTFDEFALLERRPGSDEGDEVGCVDPAPAPRAASISVNTIAIPAALPCLVDTRGPARAAMVTFQGWW